MARSAVTPTTQSDPRIAGRAPASAGRDEGYSVMSRPVEAVPALEERDHDEREKEDDRGEEREPQEDEERDGAGVRLRVLAPPEGNVSLRGA